MGLRGRKLLLLRSDGLSFIGVMGKEQKHAVWDFFSFDRLISLSECDWDLEERWLLFACWLRGDLDVHLVELTLYAFSIGS